ncbi:MAG: hypothetical protein GX177_08775 [Firmicutes bacterium]|jgi:hypothetical protein|nr:hypothetical protein [Bacillota bacterium]
MSETIKAKVIQLVQKDPFLSIEEIASQVETTPRYVRTILSEANLSLLQLRKQYARAMEQQLKREIVPTAAQEYDPQLKLVKVIDPVAAELLDQDPDAELMKISRMQRLERIPIFCELITYLDLELRLDDLSGPLRQILTSAKGINNLQLQRSWVEVAVNQGGLSKLLTAREDQPLLKLTYLLTDGVVPIGIETQWLPTEGILLRSEGGAFEIAGGISP